MRQALEELGKLEEFPLTLSFKVLKARCYELCKDLQRKAGSIDGFRVQGFRVMLVYGEKEPATFPDKGPKAWGPCREMLLALSRRSSGGLGG